MKAVLNDLYQTMSESCAEVFAFKKVRKEKKSINGMSIFKLSYLLGLYKKLLRFSVVGGD